VTAGAEDIVALPQWTARQAERSPRSTLTAAAIFAFLLVTWVLPLPLPVRPDFFLLDPSWQIALSEAFLRGAQFGRDIIYTYGPWGFLETPRGDPRIYPWLVAGRLLIAIPFAFGLASVAVRGIRNLAGRLLLVALIALFADPVYVLPVLLLIVSAHVKREWLVHVLAIACALTVWIKFTCFVTVLALAVALAAKDILKRRFPVVSVEIAACGVAFWLLAGQSIFGLGAFLHGALSTATSYSKEMFTPGPQWEIEVAVLLLLALAVSAAISWLPAKESRARALELWPCILWVTLLFFLQLKEAFVRQDVYHTWMGIVNALIPSVLLLGSTTGLIGGGPALDNSSAGTVNRVCAAWVIFLSIAFSAVQLGTGAGIERRLNLTEGIGALARVLRGESPALQYRRQLAEFQRLKPLPRVAGTASLMPDYQAMLYGNEIAVNLPPVPQSFAAYNSYLAGLNASFYRSARRPDVVFFDVLPIDQRYPTASDALSWLALLDCYSPAGESGGYLLLRASGCRNSKLEAIGQTSTVLGRNVPVPEDGRPIWVQFDLRLTGAGSLLATLAKPPLTLLSVRTTVGAQTFRISPEAGSTGFLLSPLISNRAAFQSLVEGTGVSVPVREMSIMIADEDKRWFQPGIAVRFFRVATAPAH
jgi:hypothetical protein